MVFEKKQIKVEDESSYDDWSSSESETIPVLESNSCEESTTPTSSRPGNPGRISDQLLSVAAGIVGNLSRNYQTKPKDQEKDCSSIPPAPPSSSPDEEAAPSSGERPKSMDDLSDDKWDGSEMDIAEVIKIFLPIFQSIMANAPSRQEKKEDNHFISTMMTCLAECLSTSEGISNKTTKAYIFIDKLFCCYKVMAAMECSRNKNNALFTFAFKSFDKSICDQFKNALAQLSSESLDWAD